MKPSIWDLRNLDLGGLLEHLNDGVYFTDMERRIVFWNRAAERITGFTAEEVLGGFCHEDLLQHVDGTGARLCHGHCPLAKTLEDGQRRRGEIFLHHKDGHRVPVAVRVAALYDREGTRIGAAEFFTDISGQHAARERLDELEALALVDTLTQLSNRSHIEAEIEARLEERRRYGLEFGVLFMDLDRFKSFNDRFGHNAGDQALKTVARTLRHASRTFDQVGRWGGEEFVAVLRGTNLEDLERIAERYRALVAESSIRVAGGRQQLTISVGGTLAGAEDTPESLVRRADQLMYESKRRGRNAVTLG